MKHMSTRCHCSSVSCGFAKNTSPARRKFQLEIGKEFCFDQYFEVLIEEKLKLDGINQIIECTRLSCHRFRGEIAIFSLNREFCSVQIDTIRVAVQTFRRNTMIEPMIKTISYSVGSFRLCGGVDAWENGLFYLNNFFFALVKEFHCGG